MGRQRGLLGLALAGMLVVGACSEEPEPTRAPAHAAASAETGAPAARERRPVRPPILDTYGNLRGSGRVRLGFELPVGAEEKLEGPSGPVAYMAANEERLLRFYRTRGHQIIKLPGGWRLEHTQRTLRRLAVDDARALRKARLRLHQGPGPGFTMRFDDGEPLVQEPTALEALLEAEREEVAPSGAPHADPKPAPEGVAPESREERIARLKASALGSTRKSKRSRDISRRIYEWSKRNPDKRFRD